MRRVESWAPVGLLSPRQQRDGQTGVIMTTMRLRQPECYCYIPPSTLPAFPHTVPPVLSSAPHGLLFRVFTIMVLFRLSLAGLVSGHPAVQLLRRRSGRL